MTLNGTEITKAMFGEFVEVQESGAYNMYDPNARMQTTLNKEQWITIMQNYNALEEEFNNGKS